MGKSLRRSDGQTLVMVALLLAVFVLLLALAVDVGNMYQVRRAMQNAADAGALAAAQARCFGPGGGFGTVSEAVAAGESYAVSQNGADEASVTPDADGWVFTVTASKHADLFFGGIAGLAQVDIGATAAAVCGAANSACGLWPLAFESERWDELMQAGCGTPFYVWTGDKTDKNPDCSVCQCDTDGDGVENIVNSQGRAWLDFSNNADPQYPDPCTAPGCGQSELDCWLASGEGGVIRLPACIAGDNGTRAASRKPIDDRVGESIAVPLYDYLGCPGPGVCPGGDTYYVSRFGCIIDRGWIQKLDLDFKSGAKKCWSGKVVAAEISCGTCATNCGSSGGGPPPPGGVRAVSLIR